MILVVVVYLKSFISFRFGFVCVYVAGGGGIFMFVNFFAKQVYVPRKAFIRLRKNMSDIF